MATRITKPFLPEHLHGLRCYAAYWRVWVEWSTDPRDVEMARRVRQNDVRSGALPRRVINYLVREGYVIHAAGPAIIGGGYAPLITDKGKAKLAESNACPS